MALFSLKRESLRRRLENLDWRVWLRLILTFVQQSEIQSEKTAANELHARQETFLREVDPEGMIGGAQLSTSHGLVYGIAKRYQTTAPPELGDPFRTGTRILF